MCTSMLNKRRLSEIVSDHNGRKADKQVDETCLMRLGVALFYFFTKQKRRQKTWVN